MCLVVALQVHGPITGKQKMEIQVGISLVLV